MAAYDSSQVRAGKTSPTVSDSEDHSPTTGNAAASISFRKKCSLCGCSYHERKACQARNLHCLSCGKKSYFRAVCRSKNQSPHPSACIPTSSFLCGVPSSFPQCLKAAVVCATIQEHHLHALLHSDSKANFMNEAIAKALNLPMVAVQSNVQMSQSNLKAQVTGTCTADLVLNNTRYEKVFFEVMRLMWGCQTSLSPKNCPWICYQNSFCPWFLKNILLSLNIFRRPWKFLNSFQLFHIWTIDCIEHSRIKNKQCEWTEQGVDFFHVGSCIVKSSRTDVSLYS